ncbi:hypothetical protein CCR75_009120 [Bremia lactucae]|uniref:Uncharacterized protein n=1 Tax=Bremia lactucae TaxID=4779 RepID=A0A976FNG1_BRELC|nr:hypothetical protein CCR75_009120 [Bremia lactucae]
MQNAALYVLNNHRFPKWQYSYDSSVTRTQREMTHHLVVYVFQILDRRSEFGNVKAAVLARHESPAFSLFSYRRSGTNIRDVDDNIHAASNSTFSSLDIDLSLLSSKTDTIIVEQIQHLTPPRPSFGPKMAATFADSAAFQSTSYSIDNDADFWACDVSIHQSGILEKAKHLLILWRFLDSVTLLDIGVTSDILHAQARSHWPYAAQILRASQVTHASHLEGVMGSFLSSLCLKAHEHITHQAATREQMVTQAAAHLLLRALSSRAVHFAFQSAFAPEMGDLNKQQIRERFRILILDLYNILSDLIQFLSSSVVSAFSGRRVSIPALVDEVLSLIYSQRHFTDLRIEVSKLFRGQMTVHTHSGILEHLYDCFSAQLLETTFAKTRGFTRLEQYAHFKDNSSMMWSSWNRTWLFEPGSIQVKSISPKCKGLFEPSLVQFSRWIHEFACINLVIVDSRLILHSVLPIFSGIVPTELLLDGCLRAFQFTPSGLTSKLSAFGKWSFGDYTGNLSPRSNTLTIDLYALKDNCSEISSEDQALDSEQGENSISVCRISMTFALKGQLLTTNSPDSATARDSCILIRGDVAQATYLNQAKHQLKLSRMSAENRSVILRGLPWATELIIQAEYVAVSS